jgi:hypothetical protein
MALSPRTIADISCPRVLEPRSQTFSTENRLEVASNLIPPIEGCDHSSNPSPWSCEEIEFSEGALVFEPVFFENRSGNFDSRLASGHD